MGVCVYRNYLDHKFWSGTFILLSLGVGVVAVLPWLQAELGGYHPIALVLMESSRPVHVRQPLIPYIHSPVVCVCVCVCVC